VVVRKQEKVFVKLLQAGKNACGFVMLIRFRGVSRGSVWLSWQAPLYCRCSALTPWEPAYEYITPGNRPKTSSFLRCLTNAIAPLLIALESSSNPQSIRQVFWSALEKNFLVGGCEFFVSDVISEVVFGHFGSCYLA